MPSLFSSVQKHWSQKVGMHLVCEGHVLLVPETYVPSGDGWWGQAGAPVPPREHWLGSGSFAIGYWRTAPSRW